MSAARRLLLPGLTTALMVAVLVGLGVWQLHRLQWKLGVLAQLDAAERAAPVPLPFNPQPLQKVRIEGRWMPDRLAYYGAEVRATREGSVMGAEALMPLQMGNASIVLVDMGWVPMSRKMPLTVPRDTVTVIGWLRPTEQRGLFSPADAPAARRFYTLNTTTIANALGLGPVMPFVVVQLANGPLSGYPTPHASLPRPPNNHLGYAITWFALALAALGVFGAYARGMIRPRPVMARPEPAPSEWPTPPAAEAELGWQPAWPTEPVEDAVAPGPGLEGAVPTGVGGAAEPASESAAYARLTARFARIATIREASGMLSWDAAAMMPEGGGPARGEQLAVLAGLAHALLVAPEVADDLAEAEAAGVPADPWQAANLRLMREAHVRASALPAELVEAEARAGSACEKIWREARRTDDFPLVAPALRDLLALVRERATVLSAALRLAPYDALMDGHQRGAGLAEIEPLFSSYEVFLRDALPRAEELQALRPPPRRPPGPFPLPVQEALCRHLSAAAGLEPDYSRIDRSAHPFCGGTPTDVRITTRYDEADFARALLAVMHETGHALYERGLPIAWSRQPVGAACGMAAHESQSLIIEMQACRSDAFLGWLGRELHVFFGGDAAPYAPDNLARLWRRVERSLIRVDADEMTYPAHVILRLRLEQALISGDLVVADLPAAWSHGMRSLLGIAPPDDASGCLQDIHWYDGAFGYFPSYTLGAMAAAQLMAAARRDVAGLDASLARGEWAPLVGWLRERVHGMGSLLGFNDLMRQATGKALDPQDFQAHLTERYLT
jgi:carboxypeptidase Taq